MCDRERESARNRVFDDTYHVEEDDESGLGTLFKLLNAFSHRFLIPPPPELDPVILPDDDVDCFLSRLLTITPFSIPHSTFDTYNSYYDQRIKV